MTNLTERRSAEVVVADSLGYQSSADVADEGPTAAAHLVAPIALHKGGLALHTTIGRHQGRHAA